MILKPAPKTLRAAYVLVGSFVPACFLVYLLFFTDTGAFLSGNIEDRILDIFMYLFLFLAICFILFPFLLALNESWEILGGELIHRWAHEKRQYPISQIRSFGPPFFYDRLQILFRGSRPRHLVVGDRRVDRMMFPYLYDKAQLEAFLNELKRINPQISLESSLAKKFWT